MTFESPWWLLSLAVVAAVAAWALFRPGRRLAVVPSLRLWREAIESLPPSARRRLRRVTASWLLLLTGAVLGGLALARPVVRLAKPARHVAIVIYPCAELAGSGGLQRLRQAAEQLVDRLAPADKVKIVMPGLIAPPGQWADVEQARQRIGQLKLLPQPASEMDMPPPGEQAQRVYHIVPAGTAIAAGPGAEVVELATALPELTFEAVGGEMLDSGQVQVFAAVRNHSSVPRRIAVRVRGVDATGVSGDGASEVLRLEPAGRAAAVVSAPAGPGIEVALSEDGVALDAAYLARQEAGRIRIAVLGRDEPLLRKYVEIDRRLDLVARAEEADAVIANGVAPPPGKAALAIDPPSLPAGWRRGRAAGPIALAQADIADDVVMRDVDLSAVAVRRAAPFVLGTAVSTQKVLLAYQGDVLMMRDDRAASPEEAPPRIYVAFPFDAETTNFSMTPAFPAFMHNATRYLAGQTDQPDMGFLRPSQAGGQIDWKPVVTARPGADTWPMPWPGIYQDPSGTLRAVSLTGLKGARPGVEPDKSIASLSLPPPVLTAGRLELWPGLALAAMAAWLAGWVARWR